MAVGDTLQAGIEQMQITADLGGGVYSVTRGANGNGRRPGCWIAYSEALTQMSNTTPSSTDASYGAYQTRRVTTLRQEADLVGMAIPFTASSATNEYKDYFSGRWTGTGCPARRLLGQHGECAVGVLSRPGPPAVAPEQRRRLRAALSL